MNPLGTGEDNPLCHGLSLGREEGGKGGLICQALISELHGSAFSEKDAGLLIGSDETCLKKPTDGIGFSQWTERDYWCCHDNLSTQTNNGSLDAGFCGEAVWHGSIYF